MRAFHFLMLFTLLAGCAGSGPSTSSIKSAKEATLVERETAQAFALIQVDSDIATKVSQYGRHSSSFFKDSKPGTAVIGVGDTLSVSIISWDGEGSADFATVGAAPTSGLAVPPQEVSDTGSITVPPIGRVLARGKTVQQFENFLQRRLSEVLVDPSVVVTLSDRQSARVALIGQVAGAGTRAMNAVDTRIIDIIVAGGGPTARPEDLIVTLSRRGKTASVPLNTLYENSRYNISVHPGDVISIDPAYKELVILGATGTKRTRFEEADINLSEALADAGGLVERRADRKGVFIYRLEDSRAIDALGVQTGHAAGQRVPTIYQFDFTDPSIFFVTSKFKIRDGDILYVSNSLSDQVSAFISALSPFAPTPRELLGN